MILLINQTYYYYYYYYYCSYIQCFVGAFESLWKSPLNVGFVKGGYYHLPIMHCGQTILSNGLIPVWLISKCRRGGNTLGPHKRDTWNDSRNPVNSENCINWQNWLVHYLGLLAICSLPKKNDKCLPGALLEGWGGGRIGHAWNRPYDILDTRHLCDHFRIDETTGDPDVVGVTEWIY